MPLTLRIVVIVVCLAFLAFVLRWVAKGRLQIRYSFLWLLAAVIMLVFAIFPEVVYALSHLLGFNTPSNFVFAVGMVVVLLIALGLSMTVSWQARYIRHLIQRSALLEHEIDELKKSKKDM